MTREPGAAATVTLDCGFGNHGRFAKAYRSRLVSCRRKLVRGVTADPSVMVRGRGVPAAEVCRSRPVSGEQTDRSCWSVTSLACAHRPLVGVADCRAQLLAQYFLF
jgi:hypothetical protein